MRRVRPGLMGAALAGAVAMAMAPGPKANVNAGAQSHAAPSSHRAVPNDRRNKKRRKTTRAYRRWLKRGNRPRNNAAKRAQIIRGLKHPDIEAMTNNQNTRFWRALSVWRRENGGARVPNKVFNRLAKECSGRALREHLENQPK